MHNWKCLYISIKFLIHREICVFLLGNQLGILCVEFYFPFAELIGPFYHLVEFHREIQHKNNVYGRILPIKCFKLQKYQFSKSCVELIRAIQRQFGSLADAKILYYFYSMRRLLAEETQRSVKIISIMHLITSLFIFQHAEKSIRGPGVEPGSPDWARRNRQERRMYQEYTD